MSTITQKASSWKQLHSFSSSWMAECLSNKAHHMIGQHFKSWMNDEHTPRWHHMYAAEAAMSVQISNGWMTQSTLFTQKLDYKDLLLLLGICTVLLVRGFCHSLPSHWTSAVHSYAWSVSSQNTTAHFKSRAGTNMIGHMSSRSLVKTSICFWPPAPSYF